MSSPDSPPVVLSTGPTPGTVVIWLHGLGADGHDFEPLVPELRLPSDHSIRFVFPNAPVRPVTINGGMPMRAWYDFRSLDLGGCEDETQMQLSIASVHEMIADERAQGIPSEQIFLAGFSQGGVIALHAGLSYSDRLAGLIALSTYLPRAEQLEDRRSNANRGIPVFLAHGEFDPVIPVVAGREAVRRLREWGCETEAHEYAMPHSVCPQEIEDLRAWMIERLGAT